MFQLKNILKKSALHMDKWKPHGPNWARTPHVGCWGVQICGRTGSLAAVAMALCVHGLWACHQKRSFFFFFFWLIKLHAHGKKKKKYERECIKTSSPTHNPHFLFPKATIVTNFLSVLPEIFMHKSIYLVFVYMLFETHTNGIKLHPPPFSPLNTSWQNYRTQLCTRHLAEGRVGAEIQ